MGSEFFLMILICRRKHKPITYKQKNLSKFDKLRICYYQKLPGIKWWSFKSSLFDQKGTKDWKYPNKKQLVEANYGNANKRMKLFCIKKDGKKTKKPQLSKMSSYNMPNMYITGYALSKKTIWEKNQECTWIKPRMLCVNSKKYKNSMGFKSFSNH